MYEGYGPGGAAVIVNVATDNRNRTVSDIRHTFSKNGGNMGEVGSVAWMFERKSQVFVDGEKATEDQLMELLLEAGADDIKDQGGTWEILSAPEAHEAVLKALEKAGIPTEAAEIAMVAKNTIKLEGKQGAAMLKLYDALDDNDDVQSVYGNYEIEDEEAEA
jgi:YebC/PmpR family DNA-binding regulatory protein